MLETGFNPALLKGAVRRDDGLVVDGETQPALSRSN
jgi:hypothetical protein